MLNDWLCGGLRDGLFRLVLHDDGAFATCHVGRNHRGVPAVDEAALIAIDRLTVRPQRLRVVLAPAGFAVVHPKALLGRNDFFGLVRVRLDAIPHRGEVEPKLQTKCVDLCVDPLCGVTGRNLAPLFQIPEPLRRLYDVASDVFGHIGAILLEQFAQLEGDLLCGLRANRFVLRAAQRCRVGRKGIEGLLRLGRRILRHGNLTAVASGHRRRELRSLLPLGLPHGDGCFAAATKCEIAWQATVAAHPCRLRTCILDVADTRKVTASQQRREPLLEQLHAARSVPAEVLSGALLAAIFDLKHLTKDGMGTGHVRGLVPTTVKEQSPVLDRGLGASVVEVLVMKVVHLLRREVDTRRSQFLCGHTHGLVLLVQLGRRRAHTAFVVLNRLGMRLGLIWTGAVGESSWCGEAQSFLDDALRNLESFAWGKGSTLLFFDFFNLTVDEADLAHPGVRVGLLTHLFFKPTTMTLIVHVEVFVVLALRDVLGFAIDVCIHFVDGRVVVELLTRPLLNVSIKVGPLFSDNIAGAS